MYNKIFFLKHLLKKENGFFVLITFVINKLKL